MSTIEVTELAKSLRDAIAGLEASEGLEDVGIVIRVGDGVAWVQLTLKDLFDFLVSHLLHIFTTYLI